jgi:aspartate/methionine/tyrosine aminotransferase
MHVELIRYNFLTSLLLRIGRRGGYMELVGFDDDVKGHIYKLASSSLCSTVTGQIMTSLMCRGPQPGDVSYENHEAEKSAIFESLKRRAKLVSKGLDDIPGFSCQPSQGAMYCFPRVDMPPGAIAAAKAMGTTPDALYAVSLLEATGICVVPASGFGQEKGRYGFRTTFLPSEEEMARCVEAIRVHYDSFLQEHA